MFLTVGRLVKDSDGDGLPNSMDSCPNVNDDWFLVLYGESAHDVTKAINESNARYSSLDYVLFTQSADDLGENLSLITLLYIFNHGNQYRYDETTDIADLAKNHQRQAKNYGDSYTTTTYTTYSDLETFITDDGDGYSTKTINSKTDLVGVIQKKCLQMEVQKDLHP